MAETKTMPHLWTVSELQHHLKMTLEATYPLVDLEGEVSGFKRYFPSGHAYFTLKDEKAVISAAMFKGYFEACAAASAIHDGVKLKVRGRVSVGGRSQYQIVVQRARLLGEGELMQRYLELKAKLEREGLFSPERKRKIPFLPRRIGVVTSFSGAVIHDICRVLVRRYPHLEIRLFPATVQGAAAPSSIRAGLDYFNGAWRADVIIFGRGGGSYEDLFCFNDEALVRAVAASTVPTISSVGHETDFTLCDFAADLRAGTPSMAAELAVPVYGELSARLAAASTHLVSALRGKYEWYAQRLDGIGDDLKRALSTRLQALNERFLALGARLSVAVQDLRGRADLASAELTRLDERRRSALRMRLVETEARLRELGTKLALLSPYSVLDRGYSLTTDDGGAVIREACQVTPGQRLHTRLKSGSLTSVAT